MHIVQVLPELNSGGVERGTVEFSRYLVDQGHQSTVISNGGLLVPQLIENGGQHIAMPVHKKSLLSLRLLSSLRKRLLNLNADVVHVRSRMPAWLVWLAIGRLPKDQRPALVSTFHGLYSSNRYSEIMGCGDRVIAISQCVYQYIRQHYPRIDENKIDIIHRGVDQNVFNLESRLTADVVEEKWREQFFQRYPQCQSKSLVVMPGRITSWKGHEDFIAVMAQLKQRGVACHGMVVGAADKRKQGYFNSLVALVNELGVDDIITFVGHHSDIEKFYGLASVVCNLSNRPEPFGRTVIEALAMGVPVIAYDKGGPAESLQACFPEGLAEYKNINAVVERIESCLQGRVAEVQLAPEFTLQYQAEKTLQTYRQAIK